jgi:hypothetical protein
VGRHLGLRREQEWFERSETMPSSQMTMDAIVKLTGKPLRVLVRNETSPDCCFVRRDASPGRVCF